MAIAFSDAVADRFPDLRVLTPRLSDVRVERETEALERFKGEVLDGVRERHDLEGLKDDPSARAYRDFFWELGIDPTKTRPAAEALARRVLGGGSLPTINTLVDAYNLASLRSGVPIAAFDAATVDGGLAMRFARAGEPFLGIGMDGPVELDGGELVVADDRKLVAVYPYRDADATKITPETDEVVFMVCGAPGIDEEVLADARTTVLEYVTRFCDGTHGA